MALDLYNLTKQTTNKNISDYKGFFDPGCENIERAWYTIVERRPDLKIVIGSDVLGFINFESAERAQKYLDNHAELFNLIEDKDFE